MDDDPLEAIARGLLELPELAQGSVHPPLDDWHVWGGVHNSWSYHWSVRVRNGTSCRVVVTPWGFTTDSPNHPMGVLDPIPYELPDALERLLRRVRQIAGGEFVTG